MDSRVIAQVAVHAALATQQVAKLEAVEKTVPLLSGTSGSRLRLSRQIKEARALATSWETVLNMIAVEDEFERRDAMLDARAAGDTLPAPAAWTRYVANGPNDWVCNRASCKDEFQVSSPGWAQLAAGDVPNGVVCLLCGTGLS